MSYNLDFLDNGAELLERIVLLVDNHVAEGKAKVNGSGIAYDWACQKEYCLYYMLVEQLRKVDEMRYKTLNKHLINLINK